MKNNNAKFELEATVVHGFITQYDEGLITFSEMAAAVADWSASPRVLALESADRNYHLALERARTEREEALDKLPE